jgi:hypothetical protein
MPRPSCAGCGTDHSGALRMNQFTIEQKSAVLNTLYCRIERIATNMKGTASRGNTERSLPSAAVAVPKSENVLILRVTIPGGFRVEFAPFYPLSHPGNNLVVQATRFQNDVRKNDWQFRFNGHEWQRTQNPLSDEEIRECLTPEGPSVSSRRTA